MTPLASSRVLPNAIVLSAASLPGIAQAHYDAELSDSFAVAVIADGQNYVDYPRPQPARFEIPKRETGYLASRRRQLNLAVVTYLGGVAQHGDGTSGTAGDITYGAGYEWDLAREAMSILADARVPFGMVPGKHHYDNQSYADGFGEANNGCRIP